MPWSEFTALLLLATAVSFTPGPNTTLSTAIAANRGLRGALRFVCAVPVGWSALLVLCALGVGALLLAVPALRWAVLLAGVAYMLWLASRLASLSPQQFRVLALVAEGLLNKQIADRLDVQERTVKAHLTAIFERLGVRNRTQAGVVLRELELSDPARQIEA